MKKILFGMTLLAGAVTMTSCGDFLTEEPELKQSNELTFATFEGIDAAAAALCGMMQSAYWYDGQFILMSELRAGNAKNPVSEPGSGRYRQDTQWNYTENNTSSCWSYAYYTIARANNVINNIDATDMKGYTQQDADNVKAEALFVRALCHLDLVITYAQPYSLQPEGPGVPVDTVTVNGKPARNTVREVYAQIESDLLQAESLMSDNYQREGVDDNAAVPSKQAIQALLSRVYLYMKEWQKSADYATKVINSGKYSLVDADAYKAMWSASVAPKGGEIIFEVYGSNKNEYWDASGWEHLPYILDRGNDGSADVCATTDLMDLYEEGDVRASLYELSNGDYFVLKYKGKEGAVPRQVNVPVLRLAEMYLNRAEAISQGASVSGVTARGDLEAIASKRGATVPQAFNVFVERRKELAFEGHICYDYARNGLALERKDFDGTVNQNISAAPNNYRWALPIPKRELEANPNMVQNEGY